MRTLVTAALALLAAQNAAAESLAEAMRDAANNNPSLAAERERVRATRESLPLALAQALPQINLSATATRSEAYGPAALPGGREDSYSGAAQISQLLFASGGVLADVAQARAQIAVALANYEGARQQLLLDVAGAYAGVRQAEAVLRARETAVTNLTELRRFANAQFEAGLITRTDLALAEARLARARAQAVQAQGQLAAANAAYLRLVGRAPAGLTPPPAAAGLPASLQQALDNAGRANPSLLAAIAARRQADAAVDAVRSDRRPRVSLEGSSTIGGVIDDDTTESSRDSLGVRFSWPLFDGGANWSRTRQQRALRSAANLDVAAAQRRVEETVTNAWTGLNAARASFAAAQDQVTAAELAYRGARIEQETGLRATVEVLDAEQDLLDARILQAQAERDVVVAERQLLAASGGLEP